MLRFKEVHRFLKNGEGTKAGVIARLAYYHGSTDPVSWQSGGNQCVVLYNSMLLRFTRCLAIISTGSGKPQAPANLKAIPVYAGWEITPLYLN